MLLLSIHPQYVDKIFSGEKRVELRRRRPRVQFGDLIAIYATSPRCELVGVVRAAGVRHGTPHDLWGFVRDDAAVDRQQYTRYFRGSQKAVGIMLADPFAFRRPKPLKELQFVWPGFRPPQGFGYLRGEQIELINGLHLRRSAGET